MSINKKMRIKKTKQFNTPILLIVYNRPELTLKVFNKIRELKPKYLFIAADGPNPKKQDDKEKCKQARKIINFIDWPCKVKTKFRKNNLGCALSVSSAITWFFDNIEEGIILEDDCLPSYSFFYFCENLLEKYKKNKDVMVISGTNLLKSWKYSIQDYHFSRQINFWGWATWRRAWKKYSHDLSYLKDRNIQEKIKSSIKNKSYYKYLLKKIDKVKNNKIDSWGYRWMATCYANNGKIIIPSKNLVKNIGFSSDALHTKNPFSWMAKIKTHELKFPLRDPKNQEIDYKFDKKIIKKTVGFWNRITNKIFEIIRK